MEFFTKRFPSFVLSLFRLEGSSHPQRRSRSRARLLVDLIDERTPHGRVRQASLSWTWDSFATCASWLALSGLDENGADGVCLARGGDGSTGRLRAHHHRPLAQSPIRGGGIRAKVSQGKDLLQPDKRKSRRRMVGMFLSIDMLLFYIFFEAVLIPMFLIIGIWGGERRIYASFKFFLYTLFGSVLMLIAIIFMYQITDLMNIEELQGNFFTKKVQIWLWLAFFASFAVKIPMWPFHTWLPDAHVEAPTAGSVILAGVLLKMGAYGFIRFSIGMFPEASEFFLPLIFSLSVIAIIYTSLVALAQTDMKKLIAYSSVAHMGIVTIGIFVLNQQGIEGAMMQIISETLSNRTVLLLC